MRLRSVAARGKHIVQRELRLRRFYGVHEKYRAFTMMPREGFAATLAVAEDMRNVPGCVVECGVWRGGMIAGMAEVLGASRQYFLFDSFEGLPPPKEIDGAAANAWAKDPSGPTYFDNARAEQSFAEEAMKKAGAMRYTCVKGWFDQTVPAFKAPEPIAVLRLDGDWYDSIIVCLRGLAPQLAPGGIVLVDDYWVFDGCSRAIHQYLAETQSLAKIDRAYDHTCVVRDFSPPVKNQP